METIDKINDATSVAKHVAGEDIRPGDYVTALTEIVEWPSFFWGCSGVTLAVDEPVRTLYKACGAGQPYQVIAVCLPFVYTKRANDETIIFDVRKHQLARLNRKVGRKIWKRLQKL